MSSVFFWKGAIIGLNIAAPVGAIGLLCIRRSISHGAGMGLATGLGAATADACYAAVAAFGLSAISTFLNEQRLWLGSLGGLFLIYLGWRTARAVPPPPGVAPPVPGYFRAYLSTLALTLTNPSTILAFLSIFSGVGFGVGTDGHGAAALVLGVFAGSAAWWVILSNGVGFFREKVSAGGIRWINRISGLMIAGLGGYSILQVWFR